VRYFFQLRQQGVSEKRAVALTLDKYRQRKKGDRRLSASTIRNWVCQVKRTNGDYRALRPKSRRPKQITFRVPDTVVGIIFTLRHQLGWGGHRIAAELKTRGIAKVSGRTVYKIFDRLGLPVKIYALKGKTGVSAKALAKPFGRTVVSFQNRSAAASVKDCRTSWRRFFSRMSSISFKSVDSH